MNSLVYRYLSGGVLTLWGTVLSFIYFSGRLSSYLHPSFHPLVLYCGGVLVVLAILTVVAPKRVAAGCAAPTFSSWGGIAGALILIVPLLGALAATKDSFGNTTVHNRSYVEDASQLPALPPPVAVEPPLPGDPPSSVPDAPPTVPRNAAGQIEAEVTDLLYAAQEPEMRKTLENQQVQIIGQMVPAKVNNAKGDKYDVVRLYMVCCAADARPVAVTIHPASDPKLSEMSWVRVTGKATFPEVGGQPRPVIENAQVMLTDPPEDTFIY